MRVRRKQSVSQTLRQCRDFYQVISPDTTSIGIAERLWEKWSSETNTTPDISKIAHTVRESDLRFFDELLHLAYKSHNGNVEQVEYCPFCTDKYNFSAITCTDGFVVLVDEIFFQMLFVVCNVLMYAEYGEGDKDLNIKAGQLANNIIQHNFIRRSHVRYDVRSEPAFETVMASDYELSEASGYLFQSFKFFVLAHELAHVVLKHGQDDEENLPISSPSGEVVVSVDKRRHAEEYQADDMAFQIFRDATHGTDNSRQTFFAYRFDFAPILFFDLCEHLERMREQVSLPAGPTDEASTHPPLLSRKQALIEKYGIDIHDEIYMALSSRLSTLIS